MEFGSIPIPSKLGWNIKYCQCTRCARMHLVNEIVHDAPNFEIIKKPMDLTTLLSRIHYNSTDALQSDIFLIFDNATYYNPPGHPIHKEATWICNLPMHKFSKDTDTKAALAFYNLSKNYEL